MFSTRGLRYGSDKLAYDGRLRGPFLKPLGELCEATSSSNNRGAGQWPGGEDPPVVPPRGLSLTSGLGIGSGRVGFELSIGEGFATFTLPTPDHVKVSKIGASCIQPGCIPGSIITGGPVTTRTVMPAGA